MRFAERLWQRSIVVADDFAAHAPVQPVPPDRNHLRRPGWKASTASILLRSGKTFDEPGERQPHSD